MMEGPQFRSDCGVRSRACVKTGSRYVKVFGFKGREDEVLELQFTSKAPRSG